MNKEQIIENTAAYIQQKFEGEGSGHDWWHIYRVWKNAEHLAKEEQVDPFIVSLGALLHDIADHKFHDGDDTVGPQKAAEWLESQGVTEEVIEKVKTIVKEVSYKGAGVETPMSTLEGAVVQDADRLDAIGAIGIARTFAYGGHKGREMYNPNIKPESHDSFESYKKSTGPTINHFYEKLLLLKDRMNTTAAKKMAAERHTYMQAFLEQFYAEWEGKK
ncbi:HD domain-containing protein [Algivirga pacifica]|uniref:HD domain-containing protein n=1 Tax=Algivirga pacifica TaxID=1162670 RepID=A0ABP9DI10_9BACT